MRSACPALLAGVLIPLLAPADVFEVRATTVNQMAFEGILSGAANGILNLRTALAGHPVLGIPIPEIAVLSPAGPDVHNMEIAGLFGYPEVLHLWDDATIERMVRYIENQMVDAAWVEGYHNASMLDGATSVIFLMDRISLVKAWSLYEMGLVEQSRSILEGMEQRRGSNDYSTRYCWLRAKIAWMAGHLEAAAYWSLLPVLRIPSDTSELAIGLVREQQTWGIHQ